MKNGLNVQIPKQPKKTTQERMKTIRKLLKFIGKILLKVIAVAAFMACVTILGICATYLLALIGKWIGIGKDIFVYAVFSVAFCKMWSFLVWIYERVIIYRKERKLRRK